ncbi:FAD-binding oxidoreductase [Maricurvus nonylphenolicus]|uniref:NAD(P)/FAD-dependent oxidoreductase n=1 Tax=Maricurvus nonylphenolicus TaxID=1008307 RepID=UPI0036F37A4C
MNTIKKHPQLDGDIGWYEMSPYKDEILGKTHSGQSNYDFVIIGAGYTGMATASRLAEHYPQSKIAIVEALRVGQGASGRNSGYVVDLPLSAVGDNINASKEQQSFALNKFAIECLREKVNAHNLAVDWCDSGKYAAIHETKHIPILNNFARMLDAINEPYERLDQAESTTRLGTEFYTHSIYTQGMVVVNPASLIMGLAKILPNNVDLFENAPVRRIDLDGTPTLHFDHGSICAGKLVFAANAFNESLKAGNNRIAPMITYSSITRPLSGKELEAFKGINEYAIRSAHAAGTSIRFTADKRLLIRNSIRAALMDNRKAFNKARQKHQQSLVNRFPHLAHAGFEYTWSGNICITLNKDPLFEQIGEHTYSVAGMNGAGVAKGTYLGHYMADFIAGVESPELSFIQQHSQPSWVPPEPFRHIGASLAAGYEEYSAGKDV